MKKDEVKVGGTYLAKVSDKVVPVRIDAENGHGGWEATNLLTDKKVCIKSAQRLRCPANRDGSPQTQPEVQVQSEEGKMASKTKGKKSARAKPEANGEAKAKKLGCLDAAARVLGESGQAIMDREVLKLMAHVDQTRAELRTALERMEPDDLIELFRDCATGRLADMDEREHLMVGMLAAMAIHDLRQSRDDWMPPGPACPHCGEDDINHFCLVSTWQGDQKVRCDSCGTVYDPNQPDAEA